MLSDKASRARSFHQNRGRRVNGEGEYVDGVVPDLRLKKYVEPETKRKGKVVHRLSRGVEERDAEFKLKESDEMRKQVGGNDQMWELEEAKGVETKTKGGEEEEQEEEEEEEEDGNDDDEEEEEEEEKTTSRLGPLCMRDLPEGRTPWYQMLRGKIPSDLLWKDLGHRIPLLELELSHLNVDDSLLRSLSSVGSLHLGILRLHLRNCSRITDDGMVCLQMCKSICDLDVGGCTLLTDVSFVSFARTHAELSRIRLNGCIRVTDKGIGALASGCRRLILIEATGLSLNDVALRALAKQASVPFSAKLQHLDLASSCTDATDGSMMSVLTGLGGCRHVSIAFAPLVTDVSLAPLSNQKFKTLRALDVTNANVGDAGVAWIAAGCRGGLRELNLRGCSAVTDVAIVALSESCTNLTCLSISGCGYITDESIQRLASVLGPVGVLNPYRKYTADTKKIVNEKRKKSSRRGGLRNIHDHAEDTLVDKYIDIPSGLRVLDLTDCDKLTDRSLASLGEWCQALEELVLVGVTNVTDDGMLHLGRMRRKGTGTGGEKEDLKSLENPLRKLNLSGRFRVSNVGLNTFFGTARITDSGASRLLSRCNHLSSLDLTGSALIGDKTLRSLARSASPLLSELALSGCARITDAGVEAVATGLSSLSDLNLAGCPRIGDGALVALGTGKCRRSLRRLNLFKCNKVSDRGLRALAGCRMLEHLNLRTCVKVTDGGLIAYAAAGCSAVGGGLQEGEGAGGEEDKHESSVSAAEDFPRLITLNLAGLPGITIAGVSVLAHKFTRLSRLEITGCASIERRDLRRLVSRKEGVLFGAKMSDNPRSVSLMPVAPILGLKKIRSFLETKTAQHASAIVIQRSWMEVCSFRAKLRFLIEEKLRKRKARRKSCLVLQRTVARGCAGRAKARRRRARKKIEDQARLDIQRVCRGRMGRVRSRRRSEELQARANLEVQSTFTIQRIWRGSVGRKRYRKKWEEDTSAAIRLEGWLRSVWAKRQCKTLAPAREMYMRLLDRSATIIQRTWRAERERGRVHAAFDLLRKSTIKIQSWSRMIASRLRTKSWRAELEHAVIVVQRAFRGHEARYTRYLLKAAQEEQTAWENSRALSIQTFLVRPWLARRRVRLQKIKHAAAVLFQSGWHYYKAKRARRSNFALERLRKREALVVEAKAREMYAVWRVEDDARPNSYVSRTRSMLESGAALVLQRMFRGRNMRRMLQSLGQWRFHRSANIIASSMRGAWARRYVRWKRRILTLVVNRIARWWRQFPVTYAYREVVKERKAEYRRVGLLRKARLVQEAWERRYAALLERTRQRAAFLIQHEHRAYVLRRIKWEEEEAIRLARETEVKAIEEYRVAQQEERKEKNSFMGRIKRRWNFWTDHKAVKKHLMPDPRTVEIAKNKAKALFDPKLKEKMVREEFETLMFSIQSRQKEAIAQSGMVDLALTCGEEHYKTFRAEQQIAMKEGRPYFVTNRVDLFSTHTTLSEGQRVPRPKFIFIWTMTAHDRTSHIITDVRIMKRPRGLNSLKLREYMDEVAASGWILKTNVHCKFEIRYRRDGRHMIKAMQAVSNPKQHAKLIKEGWEEFCYGDKSHSAESQGEEKIDGADEFSEALDFSEFGYDPDTRLLMKHALPKKSAQAIEAQYEAVKRSDGSYGSVSQDSMDHESMRRLLDQVEFAGYTAVDIDKLRTHFHKMDNDDSGSVDVDEFFEYIKENRTILSQHMFEFHGFEFGEKLEDEELDFGHFVKGLTTLCMFDTQLLVRFFFKMFDEDNEMYILKNEARQLLEMFHHQAPGVCTRGQLNRACLMLGIIGSGVGQGVVTFDDFLELANSCPTVVYPILKLQHSLRTKFFGMKYWERKLEKMAMARDLVFRARHEGTDLTQGDISSKLLNLSNVKEQKKKTDDRKKKLEGWRTKQQDQRPPSSKK